MEVRVIRIEPEARKIGLSLRKITEADLRAARSNEAAAIAAAAAAAVAASAAAVVEAADSTITS